MYKATELLTSYKDIVSTLPQEAIMKKYLGAAEGKICSPFRVDSSPGCTFYYGDDNILYLRDWAINERYHCLSVVMRMESCNFQEALKIVRKSFAEQKSSAGLTYHKSKVLLQAVTDVWNDPARDYWKQYGLDYKILRKFGVRNVKYVYRNKALIARATPTNPIFVYTFSKTDKIKVYRPLATSNQYKWLGNVNSDIWNGYHQLPKTGQLLIITSSLKDVMVLHKLGYNAIAPQSENSSFPKNLKEDLEKRFDNIVLFFDADDPGVAAARDFCSRTGYRWFTIPDKYHSKDISDCIAAYGIRRVRRIMKRRLARTFRVDEIPF